MPSSFTWLDYSAAERRAVLDAVAMFGERTTRDELGLGGVRDAFADRLFPGTSTIQTRAKYFLFVPWAYRALDRQGVRPDAFAAKARTAETKLIAALTAAGETDGVIGRRARERLQRLPSGVYWNGLAVWGIRTFPGPPDAYAGRAGRPPARRPADFDGEVAEAGPANWHAGLPAEPPGFPDGSTFALTAPQAEYLRERAQATCPRSMLAVLLRDRVPVAGVSWAWDLADAMPADLQGVLGHGWNFSLAVHGAQLLYNLMLADLAREKGTHADAAGWAADYRGRLAAWWEEMVARRGDLRAWDLGRFWAVVRDGNPRASEPAKRFVTAWVEAVRGAATLAAVRDRRPLQALVRDREVRLKGGLSRFTGRRALELWPGAAGDRQLDLRWGSARTIVADVLAGLEDAPGA